MPQHPLGSRARVLLCSVFGPYATDDAYGSRALNPMELYQNQVTRAEGPFSLRMFHRSWGIMLIHANIDAPCTLLDFPTLERFTEELRRAEYDVIGISAILPNIDKVRQMCRLITGHNCAATLLCSVGCPVGCNFCATSAMFGGKGRFINFYEGGDELFRVMRGLELIEEHGNSWSLYVFSSARVLQSYTIDQLVRLGIAAMNADAARDV